MKKLKPYYAIAGKNGYGICRSWEDCERCIEYFTGVRTKKFNNADGAYNWIEDELAARLADRFYLVAELDELLKRKLIFFSKQRLPWEY